MCLSEAQILRIVRGIKSDRYSDNPDYYWIGERYSYWKRQKDDEGFTYSFEQAAEKAYVDFIHKVLAEQCRKP